MSGSRDRSINLWNTLGQLKYSITDDGHKEWVSCVRFSPNLNTPLIVSAGWDKLVKVTNTRTRLSYHCRIRRSAKTRETHEYYDFFVPRKLQQ